MPNVNFVIESPEGETQDLGILEVKPGAVLVLKITDPSAWRAMLRDTSNIKHIADSWKKVLASDEAGLIVLPPFMEVKVLNKVSEKEQNE